MTALPGRDASLRFGVSPEHFLWNACRLYRIHAAAGAAFVFPLALLLLGEDSLAGLGASFVMGVSLHCFACAVNDLADREVDGRNPARSHSALTSAEGLSVADARYLMVAAAGVYLVSAAALYWLLGGMGRTALAAVTTLALLFSHGLSNLLQKRSLNPLLMDSLFGLNMGVFPVVIIAQIADAVNLPVLLMGSANSLAMIILNITAGNLKDLNHDLLMGDRTTALRLGVRATTPSDVSFTPTYVATVVTAQSVFAALTIVLTSTTWGGVLLGYVLVAGFLILSTYELSRLLTGARAPHQSGREWLLVWNFAALIAASMASAFPAVLGLGVLSIGWFFVWEYLMAALRGKANA